jgi:hypothetical protein
MEVSGQLNAPAALPLGVPTVYEAGWAPEPVWTLWCREKSFFFSAGNRTPAVQPVTHPYTNWAIPAPLTGGPGLINTSLQFLANDV